MLLHCESPALDLHCLLDKVQTPSISHEDLLNLASAFNSCLISLLLSNYTLAVLNCL